MSWSKHTALVAIGLLLSATAAAAQVSTGSVVGVAADSGGGVLPGVAIVAKNMDTTAARETVTNDRGQFELAGLQPGRYELTAELTGFQRFVQQPVRVQVNQQTRVNVTLQVGEMTETLTVVGEGTTVQTRESTLGKVVEQKTIVELPLSGRNFADLGLLTPGVTTRAQSTGGGSTTTFVVNGQREDANNFQLDGVTNNSLGGNTLQARPNVDAVEEFKIQTSNYSAEFGRNSGSIVQVVTKSGTNAFKGNVFEFKRDDSFQAPDYFLKLAKRDPPPFKQNQYGGTFGGPLSIPGLYSGKNRTFFFGAYEGFGLDRGLTRTTVVATERERNGDFGFLSRAIIDPATGLAFPGNQIPRNRISATALKLLELMPMPNLGTTPRANNFISSPSSTQDYDQYMGRLDHNMGSKVMLFYRHFLQDDKAFNPFQGAGPAGYLGFPNQTSGRTQHGTAGMNTVFTSTFLNEFRYGFVKVRSKNTNLPYLNPVDYGLNYLRNQDQIGGLGLPDITITGISGIGNQIQGPSTTDAQEWQISNVASKTMGHHNLRFGGELRRGVEDVNNGFFTNGRFVFNGVYTGDSVADFLLGLASEFNYGTGRTFLAHRNKNFGLFVQDDVRLSDRVTLNLGVRYDYFSPIVDKNGQTSTVLFLSDPAPGVPQSGKAEVILAGTNGLPDKGTYYPDRKNFQPRVGFAWDVFGTGKFSIRGGGGMFYNQLRNNLALQQLLSYPFYEQPVVRNTTLENPVRPVAGSPIIGQLYVTDPEIKTPYTIAYNLSAQWELMKATVLEVSYVGNQGKRLLQFRERNQTIYVPGQTNTANKDLFRPYTGFSSVLQSTNWGKSNYNGLNLSLQRRFNGGLAFSGAWTWSKSLDLSSTFHAGATNTTYLMIPQDDNNRNADWGPSFFDSRHRFVASEIWELPFGPGRKWLSSGILGNIIGGWTMTSIWTFQSGKYFTVYDGSDRALTAGSYTSTSRPNLVGDPNDGPKTADQWFNTAAFARAPVGAFGNAGRNIVLGPGLVNTDLSFIKRIDLKKVDIELRAEAFNVFDKVNLGIPTLNIASASFGRIGSTATTAREWQFGFKVSF